jgi:oligopeptide transport system substrate-binding protein
MLNLVHQSSILMLTFLVTLAACQGPTSGPSVQQPGQPPPAAQDLHPMQEYRFNLGSQPNTLDPQKSNFDASVSVLLQLYDGLLEFNDQLQLVPAVAREVPTLDNGGISRDAKTITFKLRNDVKWSDGQPVTARDFDYAIRRLLEPDTASPYASFYFHLVGAKELASAKGTRDEPKTPSDADLQALRSRIGVRVVDDYTLELQLTEPRASIMQLAALWPIYPVRRDAIDRFAERWTDPGNLISNGPFRLTEHVQNDHLTLEPNQHFYGTKPRLTRITLRVITDNNAAFAAYRNDELDAVVVPLATVDAVKGDSQLNTQLTVAPRLSTFALQWNHKRPPWDNQRVRQAFSQAIDRDTYNRAVEKGIGRPAYSWIPPGMPGHQPELGKDVNKFDPATARRLLADAGFPNGAGLPAVSLQYASTGDNNLRAQFFQAQFKENLGVDITLEPMESAAYSRFFTANQHHVGLSGWNADYPDADNWLPDLFATGSTSNHTEYSNPQLDDLMRRAFAEPDAARRSQLWSQAQETVIKDVALAPFHHRDNALLIKPWVKGLRLTGLDGTSLPGRHFIPEISIARH